MRVRTGLVTSILCEGVSGDDRAHDCSGWSWCHVPVCLGRLDSGPGQDADAVGDVGVNLLGSVVLGALTAGVVNGANPDLKVILGTGFLGGFTTFSTASVETVRLLSGRHVWAGLLNAVGMALTCLAVAAGGYALIR